ncbi:unnamed protein product [Cylindrotheca closterium]|uniref:Vta1/callose synthase N-terminal domain-containing protein n=1 Tax=Cylindrotheca closterium TaxID=2856 RepID=A0AAD2FUT2_9STRA|nr:unnamed protein product [Cylindrotheca closterium]
MPLSIPAELKKITPYIRRAEELDRDKSNAESRLVAYYCRQYAVHTGIAIAQSDVAKNCLGEILGALEGEKEAMDSFTRDETQFLCSSFAGKIFSKADTEDRNGQATRDTAKTFYAAASFLEMLQQFYQDDDESEEYLEVKEKSKYAKWKATDILKAIKEGREPTPGGYGENLAEEEPPVTEKEEETETETKEGETAEIVEVETASDDGEEEDSEPVVEDVPVTPMAPPADENKDDVSEKAKQIGTDISGLPPPPPYPTGTDLPEILAPPAPTPLRPPMTFNPPAPPPPIPARAATTSVGQPAIEKKPYLFGMGAAKGKKLSKAQFADAKELTQFALAALEDKNSDLAAERLAQALQILGR